MNNIKLSIIIVNWNTKKLLRQCLESIRGDGCLVLGDSEKINKKTTITKPPLPNTEIIVVDNGSSDGSVEMLRKLRMANCELKIIENKENIGFTKGNNQGINKAKGKYIMLLNSDTIVKPNAIVKLIDYLDKNLEVDCIAPRLLNVDGTFQESCGHFPNLGVVFIMLFKEHFGGSDSVRYAPLKSGFTDWMMGSAFIAKREVFDKIGGLDERIFMYMEEVDWFYRAHQAGYKSYCLIDSEIVHLGRGSSTSGKKEPIINIFRGLLLYYRKHKTQTELFILIVMLKLKAVSALLLGYLKNDAYLKETYGQAIRIN